MKFIGLEEHYWTPEIREALQRLPPEQQDDNIPQLASEPINSRLLDLGEERLRQMDIVGLDMMVLSLTPPATQSLPPAEAIPLARQANDRLAAAVKAHPDRFAGFATLPTTDVPAAVLEMERCITELGFCGTMLQGRTGDKYLDLPEYRPLLAKAAELGAPIYLHPQIAPRPVRALYYDGFDEELSLRFATSGWGWHMETAVHSLRLILSGVFDELPSLQIILGHWGEMVTFYLERVNELSSSAKKLKRPVADYFRANFYVTPSGMFHTPYLTRAIEVMGIDRVLYSTDYPFEYEADGLGRPFIMDSPLSYDDKAKIAHLNAEKLLKLK